MKPERKILTLKKPSSTDSARRTENEKAALCNTWLKKYPLFQNHLLMQVGIIHALKVEYDKNQSLEFGFKWVRQQLRQRSRKAWYRQLINDGAQRYDLDGARVDKGAA